jgi:hypothetical protein
VFDRHDTSGGGGFIAREALGACLLELKVELTQPKHDEIAGTGIVVWQDLHRALDLPKIGAPSSPTRGDPMTYSLSLSLSHSSPSGEGVTEATSTTRTFELFHINGVEKVLGGSTPAPRVCSLSVAVPPKWNVGDWTHDAQGANPNPGGDSDDAGLEAQLVDVVRTRWQRARCHWAAGEAPSLV